MVSPGRGGVDGHYPVMRLEVVAGVGAGQLYELDNTDVVIGRADSCDVVVGDVNVSGRHARLITGLAGVRLEDLGSTNGTRVRRGDDVLALGEGGLLLLDADVIELGSAPVCQLRLSLPSEERSAQLVRVMAVDQAPAAAIAYTTDPVTMQALYDAQRRIGAAHDLRHTLEVIAEVVFALLVHATHVTVVLRERDAALVQRTGRGGSGEAYVPVLTRARAAIESSAGVDNAASAHFVAVPRSVYRKVLQERSAVLAADVPREVSAAPSVMKASVRSTVAVPLWRGEEILGVVQVDNRDAPGMLKPHDLDVMLLVAAQASLAVANARLIGRLRVAEARLVRENDFLKQRQRGRRNTSAGGRIVGDSAPMQQLQQQIDKVANTGVTVLIEGETGSGKELVAAALHERSNRSTEMFVAINCAAMAEGLLESELFGHHKGAFTGAHDDKTGLFDLADGGTLFLDEITEAPSAIQAKLLRALQEGEVRPVGARRSHRVDVRVVAATNRDLEAEVAAGRFREDLYYRLKVFPLRVPPLRERRDDIAPLVEHFMAHYSQQLGRVVAGVGTDAMQLLRAYDWPGNVRELQNEVQRLVIEAQPGAIVTAALISRRMRRGQRLLQQVGVKKTLKATVAAVERLLIFETLQRCDNNKTKAAKELGITREGLHKKLRNYR